MVLSHVALPRSALDFSAPLEMTYGVALGAEGLTPVHRALFQDEGEGLGLIASSTDDFSGLVKSVPNFA